MKPIDNIEQYIVSEQYHIFDLTSVTVCLLMLHNGFSVVGQSSFTHSKAFNESVGRMVAKEDALHQLRRFGEYAKHMAEHDETHSK